MEPKTGCKHNLDRVIEFAEKSIILKCPHGCRDVLVKVVKTKRTKKTNSTSSKLTQKNTITPLTCGRYFCKTGS